MLTLPDAIAFIAAAGEARGDDVSGDGIRAQPARRAGGRWPAARRLAARAAVVLGVALAPVPVSAQGLLPPDAECAAWWHLGNAWDGAPRVLKVDESADLSQSPAGSMVLRYLNLSTQNNLGLLAVTSGGGAPDSLRAQALATQPGFRVSNWRADNLRVTNVSTNGDTPICIQAVGPGMPGTRPAPLAPGPPGLPLASGGTAQGATLPGPMQLVVRASSGSRSVVAVIGGPQDSTGNNAYVIAVNARATTGPPGSANPAPPPGYYATTTGNTFVLDFQWTGSTVFVANLSAATAPSVTLVLRAL